MKSFFKEAVRTFKTSGTIAPSSKHLINNCLKSIAFKDAKVILQFGAGDGCFTDVLLRRMSPSTQLHAFEINTQFYTHCTRRFSAYDNFHLHNTSAFIFDEVLADVGISNVDYIVSTLPLALFSKQDEHNLLSKSYKHLKNNGVYTQYQYSLKSYKALKTHFDKVNLGFTVLNVPPAFVYSCHKIG